jgi:hypothetical protein|tara:strand:+ start:121 stop:519 length:399 start_codon:yes stop_codon:yes gene_type:complete
MAKQETLPTWAIDVEKEAFAKSEAAGEILPTMTKPKVGEEITVVFLGEPAVKENEKFQDGKAVIVTVKDEDGHRKNLFLSASLQFGLLKEMSRCGRSTLVGQKCTIIAETTEHKKYGRIKVYRAEFVQEEIA